MATKSVCKIEGCSKPVYGYGWCNGHYHRWKRNGDPSADIPLREKRFGKDPWGWLRDQATYRGDDCLIWPFALQDAGYASIKLDGSTTTASRMMCILVHGEPPTAEHEAAHSCGNGRGGCVNPNHLRWATPKENHCDRIGHGTDTAGVRNPRAKLTENDVLEIRGLRGVVRQVDLAARFGINQTGISAIQLGKKWKDVQS